MVPNLCPMSQLEQCHETMAISRPSKNTLRSLLKDNSKGGTYVCRCVRTSVCIAVCRCAAVCRCIRTSVRVGVSLCVGAYVRVQLFVVVCLFYVFFVYLFLYVCLCAALLATVIV